jgi:NAD(P)-dependent dehydrogenase (short-subunit alcohol dehydrogenase family)
MAIKDERFQGRVVLITGGSRGLGLALAQRFAREGARLAICARNAEELERAAARLRARGAEVEPVACDVGDAEQVDRMIARVAERFGRLDVLVNNAGIIQVGPATAMTRADQR